MPFFRSLRGPNARTGFGAEAGFFLLAFFLVELFWVVLFLVAIVQSSAGLLSVSQLCYHRPGKIKTSRAAIARLRPPAKDISRCLRNFSLNILLRACAHRASAG